MTENTKLIRFSNGTMIVCMVEGLDNLEQQKFINVLYPIEIYSDGIDDIGSRMSEQFMLKAWMGLTDDVMFQVNTADITTIGNLKEEYMAGYENVVDRLFFRGDETQEIAQSAAEEEFSPEDLLELLQARDNNDIN